MKVTIIPREQALSPVQRHGPSKSAERVAIEAALTKLTPGHVVAIKVGSVKEIPRVRALVGNARRALLQDTPLVTWTSGDNLYLAHKDAS